MADESAKEFANAVAQFKSASSENFQVNRSFGEDVKQFDLGTKTLDSVAKFMQAEQVLRAFRATKDYITRRKRERQEMKQLRESLGLSKKEFELMAAQKKTNDAFNVSQQKLSDAAQNLLGFSDDFLDKVMRPQSQETGRFNKALYNSLEDQKDALIKTGDKNLKLLEDQSMMSALSLKTQEKAQGTMAARKEEEDKAKFAEKKRTSILESIANGIVDLNKSFIKGFLDKGKSGIQIALAVVAGAIIALVSFFQQLATEFVFLTKIVAKGGFKLATAPIRAIIKLLNFITGKDLVATLKKTPRVKKVIAGLSAIGKFFENLKKLGLEKIVKITQSFKLTKIGKVVSTVGQFFSKIGKVFTGMFTLVKNFVKASTIATKIFGFAKGFGTVLGKIFFPITLLIEGVRFIMNFIEGFQEGGIFEGLKRGIEGLFDNIVTAPINFLKDIVSGILKFFGADEASAALDSVEFPKLGEIVDAASDFIKSLLRAILPSPDFASFTIPSATLFGKTFGGGSINLNPIPDGLYKFAGLDPKTGKRLPDPPSGSPKSKKPDVQAPAVQSQKVEEEKSARMAFADRPLNGEQLVLALKQALQDIIGGGNVNTSTVNNNQKVIRPVNMAPANPYTRAATRNAAG